MELIFAGEKTALTYVLWQGVGHCDGKRQRKMRQGELRGLQFEEDGQGRQKKVRDGAKGLSGEILCDPPSGGCSRKKTKQNRDSVHGVCSMAFSVK